MRYNYENLSKSFFSIINDLDFLKELDLNNSKNSIELLEGFF